MTKNWIIITFYPNPPILYSFLIEKCTRKKPWVFSLKITESVAIVRNRRLTGATKVALNLDYCPSSDKHPVARVQWMWFKKKKRIQFNKLRWEKLLVEYEKHMLFTLPSSNEFFSFKSVFDFFSRSHFKSFSFHFIVTWTRFMRFFIIELYAVEMWT